MAVTLRERVRIAYKVFRYGYPRPRRIKSRADKLPLIFPEWRKGQPLWHLIDYETYITEGYNLNPILYSALQYKSRAKVTAPLRAMEGNRDKPDPLPPEHPLAQLLDRPNPYQGQAEFEQLTTIYLNLTGSCFIILGPRDELGVPAWMVPLRPDRVFIIPNPTPRMRIAYLYVPEGRSYTDGIPIMSQDMMHVKFPNPGDPLEGMGYGLPPLSSAARSADVDNSITDFLKIFFDNGAMLYGILKSELPLDDNTIARIKERWLDMYGGYENWAEIGVLDSGSEYQRISLTFDEMGFDGLDERNESRILGPFGVPPILIGTRLGLARATYANYKEARQAFWEDTFVPELRLFESEYQYYLQSTDGGFVVYDFSKVPALQEKAISQMDTAVNLWKAGVPINQGLRMVGLSLPDVPGGDTGYIPLGVVPSGRLEADGTLSLPSDVSDRSEEGAIEATEDQREQAAFFRNRAQKARDNGHLGWSDEQKQRLYKQVDFIAVSWEKPFSDNVEYQMRHDERVLLAAISEEKRRALERKQTTDWNAVEQDWQAYYTGAGTAAWAETFLPSIRGVVTAQGAQWHETLQLAANLPITPAGIWFQDYTLVFAQPINQTTLDDLHKLITQALEGGWGIRDMEKQLALTFDKYLDPAFTLEGRKLTEQEKKWFMDRSPRYRREVIARTETLRASNAGSHQLFQDWGIPGKEWLGIADNRIRDSHAQAWADYSSGGRIGPIGLDEAFIVNGFQMMQPHDMTLGAPLSEAANCRCQILPVMGL